MSYILEALKRAEQERHVGQHSKLFDGNFEQAPPKKRLWPWVLLGLGLLVNAVVLMVVFWPQSQTVETVDASESESASEAIADAGVEASAVEPVQSADSQAAKAIAADALQNNDDTNTQSQFTTGSDDQNLSTEPLMSQTQFSDSYRGSSVVTPKSSPQTGAAKQGPSVVFADTPLTDDSGSLNEQIARYQSQGRPEIDYSDIPVMGADEAQMVINIHIYANDPSQSFVLINSQRYREGERIGGAQGPLLESIIPDGVIIDFGDRRARLQIEQ